MNRLTLPGARRSSLRVLALGVAAGGAALIAGCSSASDSVEIELGVNSLTGAPAEVTVTYELAGDEHVVETTTPWVATLSAVGDELVTLQAETPDGRLQCDISVGGIGSSDSSPYGSCSTSFEINVGPQHPGEMDE